MEQAATAAEPETGRGRGLTRDYRRRDEVEAEIVALPADPSRLTVALRGAAACETLVHGIRRLRAAGRAGDAETVAGWLIERAAPLIARISRSAPVSADDREDLVQMATMQMWEEICDGSPQNEFWEVHFGHTLRMTCKEAAARLYRQRQHERPFKRGTSVEGDAWDEQDMLPDPHALEPTLLLPEALAQLDGNVRRALYLKTLGYKERSNDLSEPTISSLLGVSDRTVRNYLRAAEETLRGWINGGQLESERVQI